MELIPYLTFLENSDIFETGFLSIALALFVSHSDQSNGLQPGNVSVRNSLCLLC
jgi:hypothetical protein